MRAIVISEHGGPEVLRMVDVAEPVAERDHVVVEVAATALNRADLLQRRGIYPDPRRPDPEVPGLEFAGVVVALGPGASDWQVGDRVMGIETGSTYAERVVTHQRQLLPAPTSMSLEDAAAVPEAFITAWDALVVQGGLSPGRSALVHAGASGVGTAAIQVAKAFGAWVAVTCSAGKGDACRELGADLVLERSPADWLSALRPAAPGGVDVVLDVLGGEEVSRNLAALAPRGTIVQVGVMAGGRATVDVGTLLAKRANWIGTTLRSRPIEEKIALCRRFSVEVVPLFDRGVLRPVIDRTMSWHDAADAHRMMEANLTTGKIVLRID